VTLGEPTLQQVRTPIEVTADPPYVVNGGRAAPDVIDSAAGVLLGGGAGRPEVGAGLDYAGGHAVFGQF
jgi:hypothetical protein